MTDPDQYARHILADAEDAAASPRIDVPRLVAAIKRRRRRKATILAGLILAAAASATTGSILMPAQPPSQAADRTPASGPAVYGPACGQQVTTPVLPHGPASLALAITHIQHHTPQGPPTIQIAISADRQLTVNPVGQVVLQVLVLRHGTVVDRIGGTLVKDDAKPPYLIPYIAIGWQIVPGQPHLETITSMKYARCPNADWNRIWASPEDYQLLAIMNMPMITEPGAHQPLARATDQLIGARAALDMR